MEVLPRGHGGDGGATAVLVRCHGGHGGAAATPLRIGPTRDDTAEVFNMLKVSAVPPRRSAVLTVFGGATAINDGTTAELRRSWRCHCGLCRTSTAVAPRIRSDGGIRNVVAGARLNALAQPALVYKNTVLVYTAHTEWVTFFLSQLTNVNRFSKGETTETATELACFMVSD